MASSESSPRLEPHSPNVSNSIGATANPPSASGMMLLHWITQPAMHASVGVPAPPRVRIRSRKASPLSASAPSKRPSLKLRVGSPPRFCVSITVEAVP